MHSLYAALLTANDFASYRCTFRFQNGWFSPLIAGDGRVNQHPDMAVSQVALLRLHNFLATEFAQLNPQWTDEILYQEARKFVIAIIQHITYNEFLPILLGNLNTNSFYFQGKCTRCPPWVDHAGIIENNITLHLYWYILHFCDIFKRFNFWFDSTAK